MNENIIIQKLKESLKELMKFSSGEKIEVKLETSDLVLKDGTKLSINGSDVTVGIEIYKLDDKGNQTPVDDGDYVLQDGRTITVTSGKISDVKDAQPTKEGDTSPVEDAPVDMADANVPTDNGNSDSDLEKRVANLESQISDITQMLEQIAGANVEMASEIKKFSKLPADEPIKTQTVGVQPKQNSIVNENNILALAKKIREKNSK